ncbi:hypothetical protein DdX_01658 [Ditylenchus destructor]|uniref:Uncharacterized protein n=1 Tax=Ditylenchus destructor TaxID=166010 RepID=A0AAD4NG06_9BILA|nr:hypothetical protein DdX_01658 [Ditylenchus destructor]
MYNLCVPIQNTANICGWRDDGHKNANALIATHASKSSYCWWSDKWICFCSWTAISKSSSFLWCQQTNLILFYESLKFRFCDD